MPLPTREYYVVACEVLLLHARLTSDIALHTLIDIVVVLVNPMSLLACRRVAQESTVDSN